MKGLGMMLLGSPGASHILTLLAASLWHSSYVLLLLSHFSRVRPNLAPPRYILDHSGLSLIVIPTEDIRLFPACKPNFLCDFFSSHIYCPNL